MRTFNSIKGQHINDSIIYVLEKNVNEVINNNFGNIKQNSKQVFY